MLPEFWASPEPTCARVERDLVRDQLRETGHWFREDDVARIAGLGVRATRYPVLWEHVAPSAPDCRDYEWSDRRLAALRNAGVEPIVTLLHHGSGPRYTSLVDPHFPELFASYAAATAARYPWIRRWTPINEPLTTARFSTLYGAWYPNQSLAHAAFGRAVVNQMRAFAMAQDRIREIIPDAQFMLTEDLQSFTAEDERILRYVQHKRERKYLTCELLQGRIVYGHPMHRYLSGDCGIPAAELDAFARDPRPPDVVGWNYYPNSERWLAGESVVRHANLAMVDVAPDRLALVPLLVDAHQRLGLPFALSEVHVLGNEDERARWLLQRLADAMSAAERGVPVVAFGAWAAFGMVDWMSLLRVDAGHYEDGVFTFAGARGVPQPTLVAQILTQLTRGQIPTMPPCPGWWEVDRSAVA